MASYLMAIDAGTGSVRAVLFDTRGKQISCASQEWEHKEDPLYPGSMDFDWKNNWELTKKCIRQVILQSKIEGAEIAAISTTCMREGIVLYDEKGEEIWACANVDARASEEVVELIKSYPSLEKELYAKTGQSFALDAIPRLLWVKNKRPDIYEKTAKIGMINDWLIYKLGNVLAVEPSNGSTTGLMNLQTRNWEPEILSKVGMKSDIFPQVMESGEVAGKVRAEVAKETGLYEGTPIVVGGGDAQLGCIGVGVVYPDEAAIFGGSFWQYEYNISSAHTDPECRVRVNCHAIKGLWQYEALAFMPGLILRWYRDAFCQSEKQEALRSGKDAYEIMNEKAAGIPPGCYGMMCTFSDIMNFVNWKHASPAFMNFEANPEKYNKYTFYKAILENTALVTKGHFELVYESTGNKPKSIIFASGASKSSLWSQILADVLGVEVLIPEVKEATAFGAALIAGYGVGIYESVEKAAKEFVVIEKRFIPNKDNHEIYCKIFEKWKKVYKKSLEISDEGLLKHMWIAPGV